MHRRTVPVLLGLTLAATVLTTSTAAILSDRSHPAPTDAVHLVAAANTAERAAVSATACVSSATVAAGRRTTITARVNSTTTRAAVVDLEVYDASGARVLQRSWQEARLPAGRPATFTTAWTAPETPGTYLVKVGVFAAHWGSLLRWNNQAATVRVLSAASTPAVKDVAQPPSRASSPPASLPASPSASLPASPPADQVPMHFATLAPGVPLPSEAQCRAWVRAVPAPPEVRPLNARANAASGGRVLSAVGETALVTGNFTGTTEQILRWAACKWGVDEDVVKAQAAVESWWRTGTQGDWDGDATRCPPGHGLGVDGRPGQCPQSHGILQVRYGPWTPAYPHALTSTAFNADFAYAQFRRCYVGGLTWLNDVERGRDYAAGDAWGCLGVWYSGRWHTPAADGYIGRVKDYLARKIWTDPAFLHG